MADGLKISELTSKTPQDTDEVPIRRADDNFKYTFSNIKNAIIEAVNSLLSDYAAADHTHTGTYEPADEDIQDHLADTDVHVTTSDKSEWDAKAEKISISDLGTKSDDFSVDMIIDSRQKVTVDDDLKISFTGLQSSYSATVLLDILSDGDNTLTWDDALTSDNWVDGDVLTTILDGVVYVVSICSIGNDKADLLLGWVMKGNH